MSTRTHTLSSPQQATADRAYLDQVTAAFFQDGGPTQLYIGGVMAELYAISFRQWLPLDADGNSTNPLHIDVSELIAGICIATARYTVGAV